MKKDEIYSNVLGCSVSGYYKWKKQGRYIIDLLDKYFTTEELQEFLNKNEIKKLELYKDFSLKELEMILSNKDKIKKILELL